MPVEITVNYPETSNLVSENDIDQLRSVEQTLRDNAVHLFVSTSNYTWRQSKVYDWETFYSLSKDYDNSEIIEIGVKELVRIGPEGFKEQLIERSFKTDDKKKSDDKENDE